MQKQTTIKLSLLLAPHKQVLPLDGHSKFRKTRQLLVNPEIIHKHLLLKTTTESVKETLLGIKICMPLATRNASLL
jgi:hypothetical protein